MTITTKYTPGDTVFIIIGNGEKTRVVEADISAVTTHIGRNLTPKITYSFYIDKDVLGVINNGSPQHINIEKSESSIYETSIDAMNEIIKYKK